jgi:hypothetical protein
MTNERLRAVALELMMLAVYWRLRETAETAT